MAVGGLVVDRRAALENVLQLRGVENLVPARGTPDFLRQCQRGAAVTVRHPHQHGAGLRIVGADLVEGSPPLDTANITALAGANLLFELACVAATGKRLPFGFGTLIAVLASEEDEEPYFTPDRFHSGRYIFAMDPLDGSSARHRLAPCAPRHLEH